MSVSPSPSPRTESSAAYVVSGFSRTFMLCVAALLLLSSADASAQGRRARLSKDLATQLKAGHVTATCVLLTGTQTQVDSVAARHGLRVDKRLRSGAVVQVSAGALGALAEDAGIEALSSDYRIGGQMGVTTVAVGADQVWVDGWTEGAAGVTGAGIGVAVIDSGVADVPELRDRIVVSVDFIATSKQGGQAVGRTSDGDCSGPTAGVRGRPGDDNGHGTHVAGIIAAAGARAGDLTRGVAPGSHLISLKVLDASGGGYASILAATISFSQSPIASNIVLFRPHT